MSLQDVLEENARLKKLVAAARQVGDFCSCGRLVVDSRDDGIIGECDACNKTWCGSCDGDGGISCNVGRPDCKSVFLCASTCASSMFRVHRLACNVCRPCAVSKGWTWKDLETVSSDAQLRAVTPLATLLRRAVAAFFAARDLSTRNRRHKLNLFLA